MWDAIFISAAVFALLSAVFLAVLILRILGVVLLAVLITVLIVHHKFLRFIFLRYPAPIACPKTQDLSFALNIRLASRPAKIAAAMPPALALSPPVNIPRNPS